MYASYIAFCEECPTTYEESCRWTVGPSARNQQDLGDGWDPEKEIENGIRGLESEGLVKEVRGLV